MFFGIFFVLNVMILLGLTHLYRPVLLTKNNVLSIDFLKVISIPFLIALIPAFIVNISPNKKIIIILIVLFYVLFSNEIRINTNVLFS